MATGPCLIRSKHACDGYRVVSKAEADDIAKYGFRPDSVGGSLAVEEAIQNGEASPGNRPGTTLYTDIVNGVQVVLNDLGKVATVITRGR